MSAPTRTEFPVTWSDPVEAGYTWFRDPMHFPAPVTPLTSAFLNECLEPGVAAACATLVSPLASLRHSAFNSWVFNTPVLAVPPDRLGARIEQHQFSLLRRPPPTTKTRTPASRTSRPSSPSAPTRPRRTGAHCFGTR